MDLIDIEGMEPMDARSLLNTRTSPVLLIKHNGKALHLSSQGRITLSSKYVTFKVRRADGAFLILPEHNEGQGVPIDNWGYIHRQIVIDQLMELGYDLDSRYPALIQGRSLIFYPTRKIPKANRYVPTSTQLRQQLRNDLRKRAASLRHKRSTLRDALDPRTPANFEELLRGQIYSATRSPRPNARPRITPRPVRKKDLGKLRAGDDRTGPDHPGETS